MKKVSLFNINEKAPYRVVQIEGLPHLFYIHTDFDVDYEISIKQSTALVQSVCYTLLWQLSHGLIMSGCLRLSKSSRMLLLSSLTKLRMA